MKVGMEWRVTRTHTHTERQRENQAMGNVNGECMIRFYN